MIPVHHLGHPSTTLERDSPSDEAGVCARAKTRPPGHGTLSPERAAASPAGSGGVGTVAESTAITAETNVDDLLTRFPGTAVVFVNRRMACVGCDVARFETLAEACRIYRQPLEVFLGDLRDAVGRESARPADSAGQPN